MLTTPPDEPRAEGSGDGAPSRPHRYPNLFTGTTGRSERAAPFCADCGAAGGGLDTCQGCGRSLVPLPWLAAAWAEERAVRASAVLGRAHRWGRARSRAGAAVLAGTGLPKVLAGASLLLVVAGGAFSAGHTPADAGGRDVGSSASPQGSPLQGSPRHGFSPHEHEHGHGRH